jgi:hypothetical protein
MRPLAASFTQPAPRRSRYLIPAQTPHRGELVAAAATVAVLAHLFLAQLTLVLAAGFQVTSRLSRWRPEWLAVPAGAGLVWTLAIGPGAAAAGLVAGPRRILGYLAGAIGSPGRILHPQRAFAGVTHWLPSQLPLALLLAAAEAGLLWWLDWLHAEERGLGPARPGLIVAVRRRWTAASIRSGGVVTRDGGCLGVDAATGRPAAISWQEAGRGVLCAGPAGLSGPASPPGAAGLVGEAGLLVAAASSGAAGPDGMLADTCFMLAHAGIRRRKPVIVVDLTGSQWLRFALDAACAAADAPLRCFGASGRGYYEPVRGGDPAQATSLVMGMIDWTGVADQQRLTCAAYLADAFAVLAAAPADPRTPVLDDLASLLTPDALWARVGRIPVHHPRRAALADRVGVCTSQAEADPAALRTAAGQLASLRSSALGHWLAPGPARISLGQAVRDRAVVAFWLDQAAHDRPARMVASLVACDLMAVCAELSRIPVPGDGLAWVHGCEGLPDQMLAGLVARGAAAGIAVQLSTASAAAADRLTESANVLVAPGQPDGDAADGSFTLLVKGPQPRLLPHCRSVPGGGLGGRG